MDRYIILIDSNDGEVVNNHNFFNADVVEAYKEVTLFQALQYRKSNTFLYYVHIKTTKQNNGSFGDVKDWYSLNNDQTIPSIEELSGFEASEKIFFLTDKLSYPGSYLLNVCWNFSASLLKNQKNLIPLLGCLKKLKLWHSAEISMFIHKGSDLSMPSLKDICNFVGNCKLIEIENSNKILSTMKWNKSVLWKGHLKICLASSNPVLLNDFELIQHSCDNFFINHKPCEKCNEFLFETNFWFGAMLKVIELIDITTIPLFWYSGSVFLLCCDANNSDGNKLKQIFENTGNAALLCRFSYISSKHNFQPCAELHSRHWKNRIKINPSELTPPNIILCQQPCSMFFVVTAIKNNTCNNYPCDAICFHAHALHCSYTLDKTMFLEDYRASCTYIHRDKTNLDTFISPNFSNATLYQYYDKIFGKFLVHTIQTLSKSTFKVNKESFQSLILECWSKFNTNFKSIAVVKPENVKFQSYCRAPVTSPQHKCSPETDYLRLQETKINSLLPNNVDAIANINCFADSETKKNPSNLSADEILKCFSSDKYKKYITDLLKFNSITNKPSDECLTNFTKALATSYHGINYNIDAQGSEKKDYDCRKLVKRLIKFETLSIGSKSQVCSAHVANFSDSPIKPKMSLHSPRKKKKIAKVAEKLYKKKSSLSLAARTHKNSSTTKPQSNQKPINKTVYKTPTKSKNSKLEKGLLISPSIHKMTLRSATPTKLNSSNCYDKTKSLTPRSKSIAKKQLQKQYVCDNKKRLQEIIVKVLFENNIKKGNPKFERCVKKLYQVSLTFLKDLKTSKDLENKMQKIVKENVRLVLSLGL